MNTIDLGPAPITMQVGISLKCWACGATWTAEPAMYVNGAQVYVIEPPDWTRAILPSGAVVPLCARHRVVIEEVEP